MKYRDIMPYHSEICCGENAESASFGLSEGVDFIFLKYEDGSIEYLETSVNNPSLREWKLIKRMLLLTPVRYSRLEWQKGTP